MTGRTLSNTVKRINKEFALMQKDAQKTIDRVQLLGELLTDEKAKVKERGGVWKSWCERNLTFSTRHADRLIKSFADGDALGFFSEMTNVESETSCLEFDHNLPQNQESADFEVGSDEGPEDDEKTDPPSAVTTTETEAYDEPPSDDDPFDDGAEYEPVDEVPDWKIAADAHDEMLRIINAGIRACRSAYNLDVIGTYHTNLATIDAAIKSLATAVNQAKSAGMCPLCDGDGCTHCDDSGFILNGSKKQIEGVLKIRGAAS